MTARSEGWVAQTLRTMDDDVGLFDAWFQWSAHGAPAVEIDVLLRRGKRLIALEAKGGRRFRSDMLKGLAAIADLGGVERRLLVYGVSETDLAVAAERVPRPT